MPPETAREYHVRFLSKGKELIAPIIALNINDAMIEFAQQEYEVDEILSIK